MNTLRQSDYHYDGAGSEWKDLPQAGLIMVQKTWSHLQKLTPSLQDNRDIVLTAVQQYGGALQYASALLQDDEALVRLALHTCGYAIKYASPRLQAKRHLVLAAVQQNGLALKGCSAEFQNDKEIVQTAVSTNGCALEYASPTLQRDPEMCLLAVQNDGTAIRYVNPVLYRTSREIVLTACQTYGNALKDVRYQLDPDRPEGAWNYALRDHILPLLNDKEIVLAAVQTSMLALEFASKKLKDDKDAVMEAVKRWGCALQFASPRLQDDDEIVLVAVLQNGNALEYASKRLKRNKDIVLTAIMTCNYGMIQVGNKLQKTGGCCCTILPHVSSRLLAKDETVMEAIMALFNKCRGNGPGCCWTNKGPTILLKKYKKKSTTLEPPCKKLKNNAACAMAPEYHGFDLGIVPLNGTNGNREVVLEAVTMGGVVTKVASVPDCQNNREVVLKALRNRHYNAIQLTKESIRSDQEIVLDAVKPHGLAVVPAEISYCSARQVVLCATKPVSEGVHVVELVSKLPQPGKSNREWFLVALTKRNTHNLSKASPSPGDDDEDWIQSRIQNGSIPFSSVSERLRRRPLLYGAAIQYSHANIRYIDRDILMDPRVLTDLARVARFHDLLRRLGQESLVLVANHEYAPNEMPTQEACVDALLHSHGVLDREFSISALFYCLSRNPMLCANFT